MGIEIFGEKNESDSGEKGYKSGVKASEIVCAAEGNLIIAYKDICR